MRSMLIVLALAALAGCSKPASTPANATAPAANVAAAAPAAATPPAGPTTPITLAELPSPTKGLWARNASQDGAPATKNSKCMDGKPIDPLDGMPMKCAKMDVGRTAGGGFVLDAECANNGTVAKLHLAGEGDFKHSFTTDGSMSLTGGPGGGASVMRNHSEWTYAGPNCPKVP
jgi:hypothetical protein